jgi:glycosyltransferase involved in cell wall biosynthesis
MVVIMNASAGSDALLSVIVPAHNEADNLVILIPRLYGALSSAGIHFEMCIVDNASTDNTASVIAEFQKTMPGIKPIEEPTLGYGHAVLTGLRYAKGEYLGIMRSDNQEQPKDLCRMFTELRANNLSFYKAVRMRRLDDGIVRATVSFVYNTLFKVFFGLRSHDLNATPKVFTREFLTAARLESKDWFIDAEMVIKAEKLGYAFGETTIEYLSRLKGKSTVRPHHVCEFLRNMIKWRSRIIHGRLLEE